MAAGASAAGASAAGASVFGSSVTVASAAAGWSVEAACSTGAAAVFLAAFLRGVVAPSLALAAPAASLAAVSKIAFLSAFGSATRSVPSWPGRPLNFCQSPVIFRMAATGSVGCAPTPSQYCARSESTWMSEGSWVGWYLPISSIARPSRLVRESATTMR